MAYSHSTLSYWNQYIFADEISKVFKTSVDRTINCKAETGKKNLSSKQQIICYTHIYTHIHNCIIFVGVQCQLKILTKTMFPILDKSCIALLVIEMPLSYLELNQCDLLLH